MDTNLKRITEFFSRFRKARIILVILIMVFAVISSGINGLYTQKRLDYYNMTDYDISESDLDLKSREIQVDIRDKMYYNLCVLGSLYLSNFEDGSFTEESAIYECIYDALEKTAYTSNESSDIISISQSNWKINNINSDYYYFYVAYGDEYLTNISSITETLDDVTVLLDKEQFSGCDYYIRQKNAFKIDTSADESGLGHTEVYYTTLDTNDKEVITSEYIDSDELLKGSAIKSSGAYTFCFSSEGDKYIEPDAYYYDWDVNAFLYNAAGIEDGFIGDVILRSDNTLSIDCYSYEYDEYSDIGRDEFICTVTINPSSDYYYPILYFCDVYSADGYYVDYYDVATSETESIDLSKLTVFMSPKTDIADDYMTNITTVRNEYVILYAAHSVSSALLIICLILFAAITFCIEKGGVSRKDGILTVLPGITDKIDVNILIALAGVIASGIIKRRTHWLYDYSASDLIGYSVLYAVLSIPVSFLICYGLNGILRLLREKGIKQPASDSLINIVRRKSAPYIKKASGKLSPVTSRLAVKTSKRRIILLCIILSLLLMIVNIIFYDCDFYYSSFLLAAIMQTVIILAALYIFVIRNISKLERRLITMTDENFKDAKIPKIRKLSAFYPISRRLDEISEAAERAMQNSVKSERTKVELVTNVSHDLKTPLASIISYIDLLEKSELSEEAESYVKILDRKAEKLSEIVADLFVMAKAVSGAEVAKEELDFTMLVSQVLADNDIKTEQSGKKLCTEIGPETSPVWGDGAKLSRVVQNLLDNALRYSLDGTRIFVRLTENGGGYEFTVKNVSAYEMDFTTEEIVERFTRGDKSRTDGGSGLGLAIAKSFTEACGGTFGVEIDDDVFIAKMTLPGRIIPEDPDNKNEDFIPAEFSAVPETEGGSEDTAKTAAPINSPSDVDK